jgi:hypothetical protein
MSDNFVDFESDYFRNQINEFGYGKTLMMTNGLAIRTPNQSPTQMTFDKLYEALNKKIRLGMVIQRQANGRPLLRIENYDYFQQLGESCNLYDQPNIKMAFDKSQLYAAVNFGSDPFLYPAECDGGNGGCTFPQIAFRGFRDETFGILGECNTANVMDLKSGDVVFDTNIIDDCFRFNNDQYDLGMVLVDCNFFGPSNMIFADDQDPLGYGGDMSTMQATSMSKYRRTGLAVFRIACFNISLWALILPIHCSLLIQITQPDRNHFGLSILEVT